MTISTTTAKVSYPGDGADTTFDFTFPILDETHVLVQLKDSDGVFTTQTITTHYTVSGTGNTSGQTDYQTGTVTFVTAPAATDTVIISRNVPLTQSTDYSENDSFPAETHEDALDKLTMISQQIDEAVDRTVKFNISVTATTGDMPSPTADYYLKRNSDNDGWEFIQLSTTAGLGNVVEDTTPQLGGNLDVNSKSIQFPSVTISDVLDEDTMTSNSATKLATQQSIKAYVDSQSGIGNVVEDTTPQLGGNLDVNGNDITSPDGTDLIDIVNGSIDIQTASSSRLDITDSGVRLGGANARITTVLDEDTMSSDSATALATQQSIKAYVDSVAGGKLVNSAFASTTTEGSTTTAIPWDDSIPQNTEGAEALTVSITPTNASNRLLIIFNGFFAASSAVQITVALFQDSTAGALHATTLGNTSGIANPLTLQHYMTAGTTSATTFKVRYGPESGTAYFNQDEAAAKYGGVNIATLIVLEIES